DIADLEGFSGAVLWHVETSRGPYSLKAWPMDCMPASRLATIHSLLERAREDHLDFVPRIRVSSSGQSAIVAADRIWDMTTWLSGAADFEYRPSKARIQAG